MSSARKSSSAARSRSCGQSHQASASSRAAISSGKRMRMSRAGMPPQREEQADIPIYVMPNGDTAGARGAAIEALKLAREGGLI